MNLYFNFNYKFIASCKIIYVIYNSHKVNDLFGKIPFREENNNIAYTINVFTTKI